MNSLLTSQPISLNKPRRIAPLWHTALVILVLLTVSAVSTLNAQHVSSKQNHLPSYLLTIAMEWLLLLFVLWGVWRQGGSLRQLLGKKRTGIKEWFKDISFALCFWISSLIVLGLLTIALEFIHISPSQEITFELAPATILEGVVWIGLSITAGICEELIFRGYLQQQFSAIGKHLFFGVFISAVLFGFSHGYEGVAGVILLIAYGALFSLLAIKRGALRTGMIAHACHDMVAGLALAFLHSYHHLI